MSEGLKNIYEYVCNLMDSSLSYKIFFTLIATIVALTVATWGVDLFNYSVEIGKDIGVYLYNITH